MTWETPSKHRCVLPLASLMPLAGRGPGDVWRCDGCGKRHRLARRVDGGLCWLDA